MAITALTAYAIDACCDACYVARGARQLRDEAFHKMTLMKAEYTGRVKRRDDKIAELEVAMRVFCVSPTGPLRPLRKHARFDHISPQISCADSLRRVTF